MHHHSRIRRARYEITGIFVCRTRSKSAASATKPPEDPAGKSQVNQKKPRAKAKTKPKDGCPVEQSSKRTAQRSRSEPTRRRATPRKKRNSVEHEQATESQDNATSPRGAGARERKSGIARKKPVKRKSSGDAAGQTDVKRVEVDESRREAGEQFDNSLKWTGRLIS